MQSPGSRGLFLVVLACGAFIFGGNAAPAATPAFTIAASNVTMPTNGNGASSKFTLASVDGYTGQVRVDCAYSGSMMGARVPSCGIYVNPQHSVGANQTITGTLTLLPYGKVVNYGSAHRQSSPSRRGPALAALLLGSWLLLRRRRRKIRSSLLLLLGGIALCGIALAGIASCAAGLSGTFPYTVTATDVSTHTVVSAPFSVNVP